jgi:hypothetical protein
MQVVSGPSGFPQTSPSAPAFTWFRDGLHIAWRGTDRDNRLNVQNLTTGHVTTLADTTSAAPALAVVDDCLYLAWTGTDRQHRLNVAVSKDGRSFTKAPTLGQTTPADNGPALAPHPHGDVKLAVAWTGTDALHQINLAYASDGIHFGPAHPVPSTSSQHGPALAKAGNGPLYLAFTAENRGLVVVDVARPNSPLAGSRFQASDAAPSLAVQVSANGQPTGDEPHLAWIGTDRQFNVGRFDQNGKLSSASVGIQSSKDGLSLAFTPGGVRKVAWTTDDFYSSLAYDVV